jgi:hypothetical protein
MGFFMSLKETAAAGLNWGEDAVGQGWSTLQDEAVKIYGWTARSARAAEDWTAGKATAALDYADKAAREGIGAVAVAKAEDTVDDLTRDPQARQELLDKVRNRRNRFSRPVLCTPCPAPSREYSDSKDGKYMGAMCNASDSRPEVGVRPNGCESCTGFDKVTFTNGINNDWGAVCKTIHALADSQCLEVVAVYNATYNDPSVFKKPERNWADTTDILGEAGAGWKRGKVPGPNVIGPDIPGGIAGALGGAAKERGVQAAASSGMVQDVLDCVDEINGTGQSTPADTLSGEIIAALSKDSPEKMTLYAHSEGGLINKEALAMARTELQSIDMDKLINTGKTVAEAKQAAEATVERKMGTIEVNLFGTLERGLPPGPVYNRFTNELDPVPKIIARVQQNYSVPWMDGDPLGADPVHRFRDAPSYNPMDAHGMQEAYIPELNKLRPKGNCC